MAYVFIRKAESNPPDYGQIAQSGATVALSSEDPHLADEIQKVKDAGGKFAIWLPAHQGQDPVKYGNDMAAFAQHYQPDAMLPNLEGMQNKASSGGSEWNQAMMAEYAKYVPPGSIGLSVVTEPGEKDFDYSPFINYGGGVVNEAFTGDMKFKDPDQMRQQLIDAGVPPDRINMLLAPGQQPGSEGTFSAYTWDDMNASQRAQFLDNYAAHGNDPNWERATTGGTGGTWTKYDPSRGAKNYGAPNGTSNQSGGNQSGGNQQNGSGGADQYNQLPDTTPRWSNVPDKDNPASVQYSNMRLAQLRNQGIRPEDYGLGNLDPTAQWRALSAIVGAQEAVSQGHGADYVIPPGTPPEIVAQITHMQEAAATPDTAPPGDDVIRPGQVPSNPELVPPNNAPQPGKTPMDDRALALIRQAALQRANTTQAPQPSPTGDDNTIRPTPRPAPQPTVQPTPSTPTPTPTPTNLPRIIAPGQFTPIHPMSVPTPIVDPDIARIARSRALGQ